MNGLSIACWLRRITVSDLRRTGWTWRGLPSRTGTNRITIGHMPIIIATF